MEPLYNNTFPDSWNLSFVKPEMCKLKVDKSKDFVLNIKIK